MPRQSSTAAPPAAPAPELRLVPLDRIDRSPHNPRKTFDKDALAQLAESIRAKGVLEPVILRPLVDGRLELVAGERRVRAAKLAGLAEVPAIVRDLSDKEAAEVQVIENDQREDVPPLEQAVGYHRLVELGDDAETIAAKIGRPVKYVAGRLQLLQLAPELQEDLREGRLPFGHAWLLSRLPAADQLELRPHLYEQWGPDKGQACSLQELRRRIRDNKLWPLSAAPWKWDDEALVPEAGSCKACPKRSGNNRTLFDELLNGDAKKGQEYCTDGSCYRRKREAFVELQVKRSAEANGGEPLKLSTRYTPADKSALGCDRYEVLDRKSLKAAPAGQVKTAVIVEGYDEDKVGKLVQVRLKKAPAAGARRADPYAREQAARRKKAEAYKVAALRANAIVAAKVEEALKANGLAAATPALLKMLRHLAAALTDCGGADACRMVARRRGLDRAKADHGRYDATRAPVEQLAHSLDSARDLLGLIAEVVAAHESNKWCFSYYSGHMSADEKAFWKAFGVDRAKLVQAAEAEKKPAGGAKGKAKKGRKAKAGAAA